MEDDEESVLGHNGGSQGDTKATMLMTIWLVVSEEARTARTLLVSVSCSQ